MASFRKKGRVSVWLGQKRPGASVDLLKDLCGVSAYNLDDQETNVDDATWKKQSVGDLLQAISYSSSFIEAASSAASEMGITRALYAICQFDFAYDPKKTKQQSPTDPVFLGHFPWDDSEDDM